MKPLIFLIVFFTCLFIIMGNIAYAKDWQVTVTDRTERKAITVVYQKINDKGILIVTEGDMILGPPIPIKKSKVESLKPTKSTKPATKSSNSSFLEMLNRAAKK